MSEEQHIRNLPLQLFYSYAHEDETWRKKLSSHLSSLCREKLINDRYDGNIDPGTDWP